MAKKQATPSEVKNASTPNVFSRFSQYVEASRLELRKVTWPTLKETKRASLAVLGFVAVMAVLLGLVDLGLSSLIKTVLS
ncbi:MAG: preprotein translocase subunit SecE [Desulfovibrio sp.]|nr:preprotein translocase subunit SecE [Desulfovibrio sp.]